MAVLMKKSDDFFIISYLFSTFAENSNIRVPHPLAPSPGGRKIGGAEARGYGGARLALRFRNLDVT